MSERTSHADTWHDDVAAYVLDALDEREAHRVAEHVAGCESCRERVRWLTPAVDVLPASVTPLDPPPELRSRLMEIVEREAAEETTASAPAVKPRRRISLPVFGSFALRPALASFGIALLLVAGVTGYALRDRESTQPATFAATPASERSIASGELEVDGDEGSLQVTNLPAPRRDEVYQAWVQHTGQNGRTVPSSVFVVDNEGTGEVAIPSGLDGAARVMVTREPEGGSAKPTESPLLVAELE